MTDSKVFGRIKKLTIALFVVILPVLLCFCGADEERVTNIEHATIKNDKNSVKIEITLSDADLEKYANEKLALISLSSLDTSNGVTVLARSKAKSQLTFTLKLDEQSDSFLSSPLALAATEKHAVTGKESFTLITELEFIANTSMLAEENHKPIQSCEIKGIESDDITLASALGATNVLFEVRINDFLLLEHEDGAINYIFDGNSYYFSGEEVNALDKKIKEATEQGQRVYLRTVISALGRENCIDVLYFGAAARRTEGFAVNAGNSTAMSALRAFYDFIGQRYNSRDMLVADYIVGRAVNNYGINCHAPSVEEFEDSYFLWLSTAASILRSYNRNIQLYVSVDGNLRAESGDAVGSKAFLTSLSAQTKKSGGLDFAIALSLSDGEDVGEILAGSNKDVSFVNANSFSLLADMLSTPDLLYRGESRAAIIDSLSLPKSITEQNRAAYYTYTYYKAREAGFGAFFYTENRLGGDLIDENGNRGDLYKAISLCGSDGYEELGAYLGKVYATDMPDPKNFSTTSLVTEEDAPCDVSQSVAKNKKSLGIELWELSPIGSALDARSTSGQGSSSLILTTSLEDGSAGLIIKSLSGKDILSSGYVGIAMQSPYISDVELIISANGDKGRELYVGSARIGSEPKTYYFNLSGFSDKLHDSDKIVLLLRLPDDVENRDATLIVNDIALYGSSGNNVQTIKASIAVALTTLAICALLFLLTQKRRKKRARHTAHDAE